MSNKQKEKPASGKGQDTRKTFIRRTGRTIIRRGEREEPESKRPVFVKSRTMLKVSNLDNKITNQELFVRIQHYHTSKSPDTPILGPSLDLLSIINL